MTRRWKNPLAVVVLALVAATTQACSCGTEPPDDSGPEDAGDADADGEDGGGLHDSGAPDGGLDGGQGDGGDADAGARDAGAEDAGPACDPGYILSDGGTCVLDTPDEDGLLIWLDADVSESVDVEDGGVARWIDRREGVDDYEALGFAETRRPTYQPDRIGGRPSLSFDGVDDFIAVVGHEGLADAAGYTVVIVADTDGTSAQTVLAAASGDAFFDIDILPPGSTVRFQHLGTTDEGDAQSVFAGGLESGAPTLLVARRIGDGEVPRLTLTASSPEGLAAVSETVDVYTSNISGPHALIFGDRVGQPLRGSIGEVLVFDRALGDEELDPIRAYLAAKWDL